MNNSLRWMGSKARSAAWLIGLFPQHTTYVEPFGGSGIVLQTKSPSRIEVWNDIDGELHNFYSTLRACEDDLVRAIELTPYSRREFFECHQALLHNEPADPVERARRFLVVMWQSYETAMRPTLTHRTQRSVHQRSSTCVDDFNSIPARLRQTAARFKNVQLDHRDALAVIEHYDTPETLFYCDPPYVQSTRSDDPRARYTHEYTEDDHVKLAEALHQCRGAVLISGYRSPLYSRMYKD